jgi:hypothetical protein
MRALKQEEMQNVSAGQTLNNFFVTEQLLYSHLYHVYMNEVFVFI